jgi:dihydroorotase-like cyclic amidohydrolase
MQKYLIKSAQVVNEGSIKTADLLISDGRMQKKSMPKENIYSPVVLMTRFISASRA